MKTVKIITVNKEATQARIIRYTDGTLGERVSNTRYDLSDKQATRLFKDLTPLVPHPGRFDGSTTYYSNVVRFFSPSMISLDKNCKWNQRK